MLQVFVSLIGVLITLMVAFNGALGRHLSVFEVSFLIHFTGLIALIVAMLIKRQRFTLKGIPAWFYLSGMLGASIAAIDAYGTQSLGVTTYIAIVTASQIIFSIIYDAIGVGHLERIPFNTKRFKSIALLILGVGLMLFAQIRGL